MIYTHMPCRATRSDQAKFRAPSSNTSARLFFSVLILASSASGFNAWTVPNVPHHLARTDLRPLRPPCLKIGHALLPSQRRRLAPTNHRNSHLGIRMQEDQEEISAVTQGFVPVLKLRALYISWFMINWTDRMWEFSVPFFLLTMDTIDSMRFALIYGTFRAAQK
jgi:hypothetical protein